MSLLGTVEPVLELVPRSGAPSLAGEVNGLFASIGEVNGPFAPSALCWPCTAVSCGVNGLFASLTAGCGRRLCSFVDAHCPTATTSHVRNSLYIPENSLGAPAGSGRLPGTDLAAAPVGIGSSRFGRASGCERTSAIRLPHSRSATNAERSRKADLFGGGGEQLDQPAPRRVGDRPAEVVPEHVRVPAEGFGVARRFGCGRLQRFSGCAGRSSRDRSHVGFPAQVTRGLRAPENRRLIVHSGRRWGAGGRGDEPELADHVDADLLRSSGEQLDAGDLDVKVDCTASSVCPGAETSCTLECALMASGTPAASPCRPRRVPRSATRPATIRLAGR